MATINATINGVKAENVTTLPIKNKNGATIATVLLEAIGEGGTIKAGSFVAVDDQSSIDFGQDMSGVNHFYVAAESIEDVKGYNARNIFSLSVKIENDAPVSSDGVVSASSGGSSYTVYHYPAAGQSTFPFKWLVSSNRIELVTATLGVFRPGVKFNWVAW